MCLIKTFEDEKEYQKSKCKLIREKGEFLKSNGFLRNP